MTRAVAKSEILTDRLRLRPAVAGDLAAIHAIMSDPQAMRYWSTVPHPDVETSRQWLASMIEARSNLDFIIDLDGRCIGKVGCWRPPEIGYILARDFWGQGFASEALAAFIAYAFAGYIDHLIADVDPRNKASLDLLARVGFHETHRAPRTWFIGGEWCDSVYLRLDRPEGG